MKDKQVYRETALLKILGRYTEAANSFETNNGESVKTILFDRVSEWLSEGQTGS